MKEFLLLFRQPDYDYSQATPEKMQTLSKKWQDWIDGIKTEGKFAQHGARLSTEGKVLKSGGVITDGPFVEIKEALGGFVIVKAENLDDAVTLSHGCPAIDEGGSVEVRPVYTNS
ncbi:MAG TPA: YciI family protein [Pricia sp.]|nr:YciI family protein [Pricia sp.]